MAEGLEIPEGKQKLFIGLFEALSLVFALVTYSKDEEIREDLGEALTEKLKKTIKHLLEGLDQSELKAYLELAEMALEKGDINQLSLTLQDLVKEAGYTNELLTQDLSAMKDLFKRLKTAYLFAHEKTTNMVHMIG